MKITGAICVILLILFGGITNAGDICLLQEMQLEEAPLVRQEDSIYYCSMINNTGLGVDTGGTFEGAIKLTPVELGPYAGWHIIAISWYHFDGSSDSGVVKIYDNGTSSSPGPLITSEAYTGSVIGWQRIDLSSPVPIPGSGDLWCFVEWNHSAGTCPAGVDSGPAIPGKSDWVYWYGSWTELYLWGLDYNWQILCIVDSLGVEIEETKTPFHESTNGLNVSPNPFTSATNIYLASCGERVDGIELHIYDAGGRLVKSVKMESNTYQLGADLVPGVYFLKLSIGEYQEIQKLIKIR